MTRLDHELPARCNGTGLAALSTPGPPCAPPPATVRAERLT
jgi:hypothetical protein